MHGRKYIGMERAMFVVGPDDVIKDVLRKVRPAEHDASARRVGGVADYPSGTPRGRPSRPSSRCAQSLSRPGLNALRVRLPRSVARPACQSTLAVDSI